MQVSSSSVALSSSYSASDSVEIQERMEIRRSAVADSPASSQTSPDSVEILDQKLLLARWLYKFITGKDMPLLRFSPGGSRDTRQSWGVAYTRREIHREAEQSSFAAEGSVTLKSGKTVDFSLRLQMNRELTEIGSISFGTGDMSDPIAVNLDGAGVRLTGERQSFDLNGDGLDEAIATLASGSAWLARDTNGNGQVDGGGELFGPASGDGFRELSALDDDQNGWIDEGDAAYQQLGLWSQSGFAPLREAGIGALATASVSTPFALKEGADWLGSVRSSGVYLREDGTPGGLQQVDLAV